ncbi:MAG: ATP-binding response regulator [Promethearchaeota archaeon]
MIVSLVYFFGGVFVIIEIIVSYSSYKKINYLYIRQGRLVEKLLKSSRFQSDFMQSMSHELRTPLNAIIGFSELFLEGIHGPLSPDQEESIENIHSSALSLLNLVNIVLDISRLEDGTLGITRRPIKLKKVIEDIVSKYAGEIELKKLDLCMENINDAILNADPFYIVEILDNLIGNAVKFTSKGSIIIKYEDLEEFDVISIIDTGIGINNERKEDIFSELKKPDLGESVNQQEGLGLGLPLTMRLVELHEGTITFTSEVGIGTTFILSIPKFVQDNLDDETQIAAASSKSAGKRVIELLIIEDDKRDIFGIHNVIKNIDKIKINVTWVDRLEKGLELLKECIFDAILLDLSLPDSKINQTLDRMEEFVDEIPIIIISGVNDERIQIRAIGMGFQDYLIKGDIQAKDLEKSLVHSIERHSAKKRKLSLDSRESNIDE